MKKYFLLFLLIICFQQTYSQSKLIKYTVKSVKLKGEEGYLKKGNPDTIKAEREVRQFARMANDGRWTSVRRFFRDDLEYSKFIASLSYDGSIRSMKPFKVITENESELVIENQISKQTQVIQFTTNNTTKNIEQVNLQTSETNFRLEETSPLNYVRLPEKPEEKIEYFSSVPAAFQDKGNPVSNNLMFGQVNFADLEIKLDYCVGIGPFEKCGGNTQSYAFGPVISGIDLKDYAPEEQEEAFVEIADITAFSTAFDDGSGNKLSYLPHEYILTAVVADVGANSLVFIREGLEPWEYTGQEELGYEVFGAPVAVKVLNQTIYVLDKGNQWGKLPCIHLLRINHTSNGNFSVNYIGKLNTGSLVLNEPNDVGGYLGSNAHKLLVSDANGIHIIQINPSSYFMNSGTLPQTITQLQDPLYSADFYTVKNAKRIDSDISGTTVIITQQNEIISLSNNSLLSATTNIKFDYIKPLRGCDPTNLAYMAREKVWVITDNNGMLHKLDMYGRYMGGDGKFGVNETNGELYFPVGATPNPISDLSNPYRYRFIVANRWGIETGFKLFAPKLAIPELKVFENMTNGNLTAAFTTSGMWQAVEGARSVQFNGFFINGTPVTPTSTSSSVSYAIQGDFYSENTDYLMGVPNTAEFTIASLPGLKRGWNNIYVMITVKKVIKGEEITEPVFKLINFYWLPSNFNTVGVSGENFAEFKINDNGGSFDYIYKPITLLDRAIFYVDQTRVGVGNLGVLNVEAGCTFYSKFDQQQVLSNFSFDSIGKINVKAQGFICVETGTLPQVVYSLPDLPPHFSLDKYYYLGTNPNLPDFFGGACESPCQFLAYKQPKVSFKVSVVHPTVSGQGIKVNISDVFSTYAESHQWTLIKNGIIIVSKIVTGQPVASELSALLQTTLEACQEYQVRLSIGCNNINFIPVNTVTFSTKPPINAGKEESVCETLFPYQLSGFQPIPTNGYGTLPGKGKWEIVTTGTNSSITPGGNISITTSTSRDRVIKLSYSYQDLLGCIVSATKNLFVTAVPAKPVLKLVDTVCVNGSLQLASTNTQEGDYVWQGPGNFNFESAARSMLRVKTNTSMSGIYSAKVVRNGCESLPGSINVKVNPLPVITFPDSVKHLCAWGSAYNLKVNVNPGGGTGLWSGANIRQNSSTKQYYFDPFGLPIKEYPLTYNYSAPITKCKQSAIQKIIVGPKIETETNQTVCQNTPQFPLIASPAGGTWYEYDLESVVTNFNPASNNIGPHYYWYTYTDPYYCASQVQKTINVKPAPVSTLSLSNPAGLRYKYYENIFSTPWTGMPDFSKLAPLKEGTAVSADLGNRLRETQYGFVYEGFVNVPSSGNYTFYMSNIDGAKLYLDSTLLVNNDGTHITLFSSSQTKTLTAGTHPVRLEYFNTTGTGQLKLEWSGPGIGRQVLSGSFLSSPYTFCQGTSVSLSGSDNSVPSVSYLWSNGLSQKTILVSEDGNYNVRVTNADGCSSVSNTVSFRKLPLPDAAILRAGGLSYSYYQNEGANYTTMPDFTNLVPVKTGYAQYIDASLKNRDNKTAFVFEGYIIVDSYGDYTYYTTSDKHSRLYIDGLLVVDNTTPSVEKSGIVRLRPGSHKIKATYYNTTSVSQLSVSYQGPGIAKKIIPSSVLYHDLTICESNSNIIAAKYASSYFWPVTQSTGYVVSAAPGTYNLTVTGANGCTANGSKTVFPNSLPSVSIATNAPNGVCSDSAFLIADPQVGQAPFKYQWSKNGTDIKNATSQTLTAKTDGNYGIRISDACFNTSANSYYNIKFITTPSIVLGTDIVGVKSVCQTGGSANILVDIYNYSASKSYKVSLTGAGTLQKIVAANPVLSFTDPFNPGILGSRWRMFNKGSGIAPSSSITASGQLSITGTNPAITPTINSMLSLSRLDLRGDLDINVKVISYTNSTTIAKAGLFVSNEIDNQAKGGYCIVSACKDGKIYFQYDTNGDGGLEGSYSSPWTVDQTNLWLRVKEQAKVFSAFYSTVSATGPWVQLGSNVTISSSFISSNVGVFVSGGSSSVPCTGVFDDFNAISKIPLIEIPITVSGDYTVTVMDNALENTCVAPKSITIGSKPNPSVSLTLPQTGTCYNSGALLLSGGNPSGGTFSGTGVTKTGSNYYFTPTIALLGNNTVSYTYTSVNACSSSSTGSINVSNILPSIDLGFDHIIEKNKPDTLNALNTKADGAVTWSTGSTGLQLIYTPTTTTYISASFTNSCGTARDTVILIDPCTFTDYKRTLNGETTGGGIFSGIYVLKGLTLNGGNYTFN
ncbi:MAG: hypothetical protein H7329_16755, partial [Opitutaceae bacterium]|nr:hypothetical protein [Cytophagales bacterium]